MTTPAAGRKWMILARHAVEGDRCVSRSFVHGGKMVQAVTPVVCEKVTGRGVDELVTLRLADDTRVAVPWWAVYPLELFENE